MEITKKTVTDELEEIQSFLSVEMSDNPVEYEERLRLLLPMYARVCVILSDSKGELRRNRCDFIRKNFMEHSGGKKIPVSMMNALVENETSDTIRIIELSENMLKAISKQIDSCRTLLATARVERQMTY